MNVEYVLMAMVPLAGVVGLFAMAVQANGERRDTEDWLMRRKEAAQKAITEARAAYDAKFSDPRDPSPEARKMRYAISQARKALKDVEKELMELNQPHTVRRASNPTPAWRRSPEAYDYEVSDRHND